MTLQSSFKVGDRVQIVLPELNLEAGAGDEYPQMGTGTIGVPMKKVMVPVEPEKPKKRTAKKGKKEGKPELEIKILARQVIEPDSQKLAALQDERLAWIVLDHPFFKKEGKKLKAVRALAVPEWLLKPLEEN